MIAEFATFLLGFLQPLSVVWLFLLGATATHAWRRRWRTAAAWFFPWLILSLFSCTILTSSLVYSLERPWLGLNPESVPSCDAVVCLGGGAEASLSELAGLHLERAGDRLLMALLLAKSGKAGTLVLGGGAEKQDGRRYSEADAAKAWITAQGLCPIPVISLGICENTHDEALKVAKICQERHWKQVLLVTSASHMNRASDTFRKAGITAVGCPCNFISSQARIGDLRWFHFPDAWCMELFEVWWHEVIGWRVYHWRGWV